MATGTPLHPAPENAEREIASPKREYARKESPVGSVAQSPGANMATVTLCVMGGSSCRSSTCCRRRCAGGTAAAPSSLKRRRRSPIVASALPDAVPDELIEGLSVLEEEEVSVAVAQLLPLPEVELEGLPVALPDAVPDELIEGLSVLEGEGVPVTVVLLLALPEGVCVAEEESEDDSEARGVAVSLRDADDDGEARGVAVSISDTKPVEVHEGETLSRALAEVHADTVGEGLASADSEELRDSKCEWDTDAEAEGDFEDDADREAVAVALGVSMSGGGGCSDKVAVGVPELVAV